MAARAVNDPQIRPYLATRQPIAGGPGSADDVAEAALYLCEPASRFVTGAELVVDGGWCVSEGGRPEGEPDRGRLMTDRPDVLTQYLSAVRAAIDAIEATQLPAIREAAARFADDDPHRPAGPCLRHRPFADGRRGDVPALRVISRAFTRSSSCR